MRVGGRRRRVEVTRRGRGEDIEETRSSQKNL